MDYVLGLDLGSASLGWAVIECKKTKKGLTPHRIERTGVRIFEAGVEGDVEQGRDASRAAARREARQPRRQNWRTQHRKKSLFCVLQQHELLPPSTDSSSTSRKAVFDNLDKQLTEKHIAKDDHQANQHLPYFLRSLAVNRQVEPYELGRAIYSLAQRRGFLSNRKTDTDDGEDGVVKPAISELDEQMNGRTLAETFVQDIDPRSDDPENRRVRRRYTARSMFHDEFEQIRATQQAHFDLSDEQWKAIYKIVFFQRPLKSQRHRIGKCEIDGQRRCLDALDVFQQFRIWNNVQNLRLVDAWSLNRGERLTLDEQKQLVVALHDRASLTWTQARKLLGLPKGAKFSIEEWNKKGLVGHRTNAEMTKVFGDDWSGLPTGRRDEIVKEMVYFRKPSAMKKRGCKAWGLKPEQADLLTSVRLAEGHARHSAGTLEIFVDRMSRGEDYSTIRKDLTGKDDSEPVGSLPPINQSGLEINNPAIIRALTELRKVVNELIREYGKPSEIRVEMARSLKNSRDTRLRLHRNNEDRRKRRERAVEGIMKELKGARYSGTDIEKWLLAEECNWECPYTGKVITPTKLIGQNPQFDIEHIFPRKYLDNSFTNKTLCDAKFNRDVKRNATAYDACSGRNDWDEIVARVSRFSGPIAVSKRKRFMTPAADIPDDFTSKHLNDTRYNAVAARKYLAMLYGGFSDQEGNQRVFAVTGGHTAILRRNWQLSSILSETKEKPRDSDHRHHAIDAVVVALTDLSCVKALVEAAKLAEKTGSRRFYESVKEPWAGFLGDVTESINAVVVSHRPTRTLPGNLHAESLYSKPHTDENGKVHHRIRKSIAKLSAADLKNERIVNPTIHQLIIEKLDELGESKPEKAFADEANHPHLTARDGRKIPIHKVRIAVDVKARAVAEGPRQRYVGSAKDSNFASMIYAVCLLYTSDAADE